jgi:hypothetical protein
MSEKSKVYQASSPSSLGAVRGKIITQLQTTTQ